MNDEMVKYVEEVKGEEVGLTRLTTKTIVIKVVETKIATVQRLSNKQYFLALKRGNEGYIGKLSNLNEKPSLTPIEFYPVMTKNEREFKNERQSNIESLFEDLSPLLSLIDSEYPLYGTITLSRVERALVTSKGFNGLETGYLINGYFRAKNKNYSGQWAFSSTTFSPQQVRDTIKRANELASITGDYDLPEGRYDVVISPLVVDNLMEAVAHMASGFSIMARMSMLRLGEKNSSEKFTMLDSPKNEEIPNSWSFDDEGTFTYNKPIIENGMFNKPLLNNELAPLFNSESTGNAGWIRPTVWNLEIKGGSIGYESLLSGNVIFINNVWYTRFQNLVEGLFSTVCRDATVVYKNGSPVGIASRIRIADSLKRLLMNIEELSKERYLVSWWDARTNVLAPYILIKDVKITKA